MRHLCAVFSCFFFLGAVQFDGVDQHISLDFSKTPSTTTGTMGVWVYFPTGALPAADGAHILWCASDNAVTNKYFYWGIQRYAAGWNNWRGAILLYDVTMSFARIGSTEFAENTWYYVAVAQDGVNTKLYVNGVAETMADSGVQGDPTAWWDDIAAFNTMHLARRELSGADVYANCIMDEFSMWTDVRTPAELLAYMWRRMAFNEPNLVSYWRLDEQTLTNVNDYTTTGNNGTLQNAPTWVGGAPITHGE